jgi:hypothetical protein
MEEGVDHSLARKRRRRPNHGSRPGNTICGMRIGKSKIKEMQWKEGNTEYKTKQRIPRKYRCSSDMQRREEKNGSYQG